MAGKEKEENKWQRIRKLQDGKGYRSFLLVNTTAVQSAEEAEGI